MMKAINLRSARLGPLGFVFSETVRFLRVSNDSGSLGEAGFAAFSFAPLSTRLRRWECMLHVTRAALCIQMVAAINWFNVAVEAPDCCNASIYKAKALSEAGRTANSSKGVAHLINLR